MPPRINMFRMGQVSISRVETIPIKSVVSAAREKRRVFLLSPADSSGRRARLLLSEEARFELATRVRDSGAPLGEIFSFISGLYFRGKLAYARAFAEPTVAGAASSVLIITASRGLLPPEACLRVAELKDMASVPITASDLRYRVPSSATPLSLPHNSEQATRSYCSGASPLPNMWIHSSAFLEIDWCFPPNSWAAET